MKRALIIGAGPAGLTAAYELLNRSEDIEVFLFEESDCFGGISKTVEYKGNRMDMGGHRFFSKNPKVNEWWSKMLPLQGAPSKDEVILEKTAVTCEGGPDPSKDDRVMLVRHRVSRILFDSKFYDYPVSLKKETLRNMGFITTMKVGFSYLYRMVFKLPETNLENFYINRFGRKLYSMFFEYYTENLWGRHPREIDASWGAQRVKGLSVIAVLKDIFERKFKKNKRNIETSLIDEFIYPKYGPGQIWEVTASEIEKMGGHILMHSKVISVNKDSADRITGISYEKDGEQIDVEGDYVISSMPLKDLIGGMNQVPNKPMQIASNLPYRDYMTLGVLVKKLNLKNNTSIRTVGNIIPDCWIYVQDRNVKLGRFQIYNNWSPYMVSDLEHKVWLGLEYFVNEGDELWTMDESQFSRFAIKEMIKLGLIDNEAEVLDSHLERVKKAYPAYFDSYCDIQELIDYINGIDNLYCVGRNGQHRYNNMDHSMMTSFEAVENILSGRKEKSNIWNVNTEKEYHEDEK